MLANPVVVPAYASPLIWGFAFLAMWAEVRIELQMLQRMGRAAGAIGPLMLINLLTWLGFLLAVDWFDRRVVEGGAMVGALAALELGVVIVETLLMRAMIGRGVRDGSRPPLRLGQALRVSSVGNLVSITVSLVMPFAFIWLLM